MAVIRRTAPEVIEKIRTLFQELDEDGQPAHKVASIAIDCGVSVGVVENHVADLPRRDARRERDRQNVLALALEGLDVGGIARRLGIPVSVVLRAVPRPAKPTPDAAEVAEAKAGKAARRRARYAALSPEKREARLEYLRKYRARRKGVR
jgi:hypothetical protein